MWLLLYIFVLWLLFIASEMFVILCTVIWIPSTKFIFVTNGNPWWSSIQDYEKFPGAKIVDKLDNLGTTSDKLYKYWGKTKGWTKQTLTKSRSQIRCYGRVSISCFISDICCKVLFPNSSKMTKHLQHLNSTKIQFTMATIMTFRGNELRSIMVCSNDFSKTDWSKKYKNEWLSFSTKWVILKLYHGENKLQLIRWWRLLCTKPIRLWKLDFYSASSLKQQSVIRHGGPLCS